jgi:LAO/AO transport system kinase
MDPGPLTSPGGELADRVCSGDLRAVARAISLLEAGAPGADALGASLHLRTGRALLVGVTGPPGAGKSTLVSQLVGRYRQSGQRVGVLAIDPSSPFSGGALLGDRVRMQVHALDAGVFIRSMATRGQLGGVSASTMAAADVLDAAGFDVILIETVGIGQDEVDIARVADICVVVVVPGAGDDVQAMKAGMMEIADIFVVNKADQPGSDRAAAIIEQVLALDENGADGQPPVVSVVATTGAGIDELMGALAGRAANVERRQARRRARVEWRLSETVSRAALARVRRGLDSEAAWQELVSAIDARREDPHTAAGRLLDRLSPVGRLDHVGVATDAIDDSLDLFGDALGLSIGPPEEVPDQGVRVRFVEMGDTRIELIEAADPASPFAASLRTRGPGLHHLAVRVDDLAGTLARLEARGVRLIDRAGRPGAHGTMVAFVHPSSSQGVLIELVERKPR